MKQRSYIKSKSKINSGRSKTAIKKQLQGLIKEKIENGELKCFSKIGEIEGMPSYKAIKDLWTIDELKSIFGIKLKIYSYSNEEIIEAYYKTKEIHGEVTSNLLKKETGSTALHFIHDKSIEIAKTELASTDDTVNEIAYNLGFQYPQHFTRLFKNEVGYTPNEYRAQVS